VMDETQHAAKEAFVGYLPAKINSAGYATHRPIESLSRRVIGSVGSWNRI